MHGIVRNHDGNRFTHRNLLDWAKFDDFLSKRKNKFVPLEKAILGQGDALTIDDSLQCAQDAALLCLKHGHQVTVFLNASHIETNKPYWFCILNHLLDSCIHKSLVFNSKTYVIDTLEQKKAFRKEFKKSVAHEIESSIQSRLQEIFGLHTDIPRHLKTLSLKDCLSMIQQGVTVENHGWSHRELSQQAQPIVMQDIADGRKWLQQNLFIRPTCYAVPFGKLIPTSNYDLGDIKTWFITYSQLNHRTNGHKVINRAELTLD